MTSVLFFTIILSSLFIQIKTARILAVFPVPSISHQVVFRPLTLELARRGHDVVVVTPDPAFPKGQTPARFREIDVHEISYDHWKTFVSTATENNDLLTQIKVAYDLIIEIFEKQVNVKEVSELLNNKNVTFDLLLIEACVPPAVSLAYIYNVPIILVSSFGATFGNFELFGAPNHPILYPLPLRQKLYNLTMWEKVIELYYNHYRLIDIYENFIKKSNQVLTKIFDTGFPGLDELKENVQMLFLNIHPIWDHNRPVPPNVIYMGGLHQKPQKDLPKNLSSLLDNSKSDIIYFSLGTNVDPSLLPSERIKIIIKVFSRLPYKVLWKWHSDLSYNMPDNVKVMKWFPQSDLLRHPKVKLFITQGGLQSTDEAITAGVPLIGIPMLGDQWFNVDKYVLHGIGVRLDLDTMTEETFYNAIKSVMENEKYRQNIIKLRSVMQDQQQTPLERAVWWTEHIIRHKGGRHLRTPASHLTWSQYYELELLLVLFVSTCFGIGICFILARVIFYNITRSMSEQSFKYKTN